MNLPQHKLENSLTWQNSVATILAAKEDANMWSLTILDFVIVAIFSHNYFKHVFTTQSQNSKHTTGECQNACERGLKHNKTAAAWKFMVGRPAPSGQKDFYQTS